MSKQPPSLPAWRARSIGHGAEAAAANAASAPGAPQLAAAFVFTPTAGFQVGTYCLQVSTEGGDILSCSASVSSWMPCACLSATLLLWWRAASAHEFQMASLISCSWASPSRAV